MRWKLQFFTAASNIDYITVGTCSKINTLRKSEVMARFAEKQLIFVCHELSVGTTRFQAD